MKIEKGQVWEYKARHCEELSTIKVIDIEETDTDGIIIHIAVDFLTRKNKKTGMMEEWSISHLPIAANILTPSLKKIIKSHQESPSNEGLLYWRESYKNGDAGVWSIDITEVINLIEKSAE